MGQTILSFLFLRFFTSNVYALMFFVCIGSYFYYFQQFLVLVRGWKVQNRIIRLLFSCVFEVDMVLRNLIKHVYYLSAHLETFLLFVFLLRTFHYMRYNVINVTTLYVQEGKYRAIENFEGLLY